MGCKNNIISGFFKFTQRALQVLEKLNIIHSYLYCNDIMIFLTVNTMLCFQLWITQSKIHFAINNFLNKQIVPTEHIYSVLQFLTHYSMNIYYDNHYSYA